MKSEASDRALADARYHAKLAAREARTVDVVVTPPAPPSQVATDPTSIEARYQAKLTNHSKTSPVVSVKPEPADAPPAPKTEAVTAAAMETQPATSPSTDTEPAPQYRHGQSRQQRR